MIIMPFPAKLITNHSPAFIIAGYSCKGFYFALFILYCAPLDPFLYFSINHPVSE